MLWSILIGFGIAYLAGSILSSLVFCLPMFRRQAVPVEPIPFNADTIAQLAVLQDQIEAGLRAAMYGAYNQQPRMFQFSTVAGQGEYPVPAQETPIRRISELRIEHGLVVYPTPQVSSYELVRLDPRIQGFPTCFYFDGVGAITLWPTPSDAYTVSFVEMEDRCPEYRPAVQGQWMGYGIANGNYVIRESAAHQKSITLLKEWLTPKQLAEYERDGHFTVIGNVTNRRYRVCTGRTFNVAEMDGEKIKRHLCFLPVGANSQGDIMLAQKIMLEQDECAALKIANMSDANLPTVTGGMYAELIETTRRAVRNHVEL